MKRCLGLLLAVLVLGAVQAQAQNTMCDPSYESCRIPTINLINDEQVGIDVFIWFAEDYRYVAALARAKDRGVAVRVIANNRWSSGPRKTFMDGLKANNIATRVPRSTPSHIKAMVFHGQNMLVFTGGNFTANAMRPQIPYVNYTDEVVLFSQEPSLVNSFRQLFDTMWVDETRLKNFSGTPNTNIVRAASTSLDSRIVVGMGSMTGSLKAQAARIDQETVGIDIVMYRLNDSYTRDALVRALRRGVRVRLLTDPVASQTYTGQAGYERAILAAGAKIKRRTHAGLTHEKFAIFHSNGDTIIPTNNWDVWSSVSVAIFMHDAGIYDWGVRHFEHKWNSPEEFK